jgi:hypothetical protein
MPTSWPSSLGILPAGITLNALNNTARLVGNQATITTLPKRTHQMVVVQQQNVHADQLSEFGRNVSCKQNYFSQPSTAKRQASSVNRQPSTIKRQPCLQT